MATENNNSAYVPNILIVDDVPANLVLLGHILKNAGYKVRPVPNGAMALKVAENEKPDLIFLDVMMPEMDGFEVCRKLKENEKLNDVPVIFISALNETSDVVKALEAGGSDYITKPFQEEEVKARAALHIKLYLQTKELIKVNAERNRFFSIIAHDLKSPFSVVLGMTQALEEVLPQLSAEEIKSFAKNIHSSATSLFRLLDNLLQWSRVQQGLIPFEPVKELLKSLIYESLDAVKEQAERKGIKIVTSVTDEVNVIADKNMLLTILRNLLSNAVKFTPKGGTITLTAKSNHKQFTEISVSDTGIGMPATMVENLFRLDVKSNRDGTDGEPSTGLGLVLCKDFVEKNGGKMWVESKEGEGSVFSFTVPSA